MEWTACYACVHAAELCELARLSLIQYTCPWRSLSGLTRRIGLLLFLHHPTIDVVASCGSESCTSVHAVTPCNGQPSSVPECWPPCPSELTTTLPSFPGLICACERIFTLLPHLATRLQLQMDKPLNLTMTILQSMSQLKFQHYELSYELIFSRSLTD